MKCFQTNEWALILGGSSGFGLASAKKLASLGMNIFIVHRDRRGAMATIQPAFDEIKSLGVSFRACNTDALSPQGQAEIITALQETLGSDQKIKLLLHSIALGNLKPIAPSLVTITDSATTAMDHLAASFSVSSDHLQQQLSVHHEQFPALALLDPTTSQNQALIGDEDMANTIYNMGTSLLTYTQKLHFAHLFAADARVVGLTSEGNEVAWKGYAAISAAKVALESICRSIAVEFAVHGIRANIIQAGVTDTPALRLIPGNQRIKAVAKMKNPFKRLTRPEDVANVVALLAMPEAAWINGAIIRADGGERIGTL